MKAELVASKPSEVVPEGPLAIFDRWARMTAAFDMDPESTWGQVARSVADLHDRQGMFGRWPKRFPTP